MTNLEMFDDCSVLIVDDQSTSRTILSHVVKSINPKTTVIEKMNPEDALEWATEHKADLVFIDYVMPEMNGVDFVRLLKTLPKYHAVPVIMITIKKDAKTRYEALDAGVTDFLSKPVDVYECTARAKNLLTMHQQHIELQNKSNLFENLVKVATSEIRAREKETLMRLARAGEHKDYDTAMHLQRMSMYSRLIADAIGLDEEEAEVIELASPLHDIGKIGVPDSILLKVSALDDLEMKLMRKHPIIGYEILQDSPSKYLQKGSEIALAHHERYDGTGYPYALKGKDIPLSARIVALADVFDALTSVRPYKEAWDIGKALDYISEESGKHFDPDLVDAMLSMREKLERIHREHSTAIH
jgi:two-component system, response regulator RpfG